VTGSWVCQPSRTPARHSIAWLRTISIMHACVCACGRQSRHRRRLDRRLARRPSSAVPPLSPAAYARRSNLCARARLRVDIKLCVFAHCAMVLYACVCASCVFACMRASACKCVCSWVCVGPPVARRGPAVFIDRRAGGRVCALRVSPQQARRGRAVQRPRRGLRDLGTRP
jgi:hypothetical protein